MIALLIAAAEPAAARLLVPPDPATVAIPNLATDQWSNGNPKKFYVFHREGSTFEEAWHDLALCLSFSAQPQFPPTPTYIQWKQPSSHPRRKPVGKGTDPNIVTAPIPGVGGLVGGLVVDALIGAPIVAGIGRSLRQVNMSSCMLPRGYARYLVSEQMWRQLNGTDMMKAIAMQAKIASGPTPKSPVTP